MVEKWTYVPPLWIMQVRRSQGKYLWRRKCSERWEVHNVLFFVNMPHILVRPCITYFSQHDSMSSSNHAWGFLNWNKVVSVRLNWNNLVVTVNKSHHVVRQRVFFADLLDAVQTLRLRGIKVTSDKACWQWETPIHIIYIISTHFTFIDDGPIRIVTRRCSFFPAKTCNQIPMEEHLTALWWSVNIVSNEYMISMGNVMICW